MMAHSPYRLFDEDDEPEDTWELDDGVTIGNAFYLMESGYRVTDLWYYKTQDSGLAQSVSLVKYGGDGGPNITPGEWVDADGEGWSGYRIRHGAELGTGSGNAHVACFYFESGVYPRTKHYWEDHEEGIESGPLKVYGKGYNSKISEGDNYPDEAISKATNAWVDVTVRLAPAGSDGTASTITMARGETAGHPEIEEAVGESRRRPFGELVVDWKRDGGFDHDESDLTPYVDSIDIDRGLTGDLPPEVSLAEGYASAELRATLSGRRRGAELSAAEVLSPWRNDSPLWAVRMPGAEVVCRLGFITPNGRKSVKQHTGFVRSIEPSSSDYSVEFESLDPSDQLHAPITLPQYAIVKRAIPNLHHDMLATNTQWVFDYILRQNGVYASPPARDDAQLSVTGHGSLAPEIGYMADVRGPLPDGKQDDYFYRDGTFGMMAVDGYFGNRNGDGDLYTEYFARERLRMIPGEGVGMSVWLYVGDDMPGTDDADDDSSAVFSIFQTSDPPPKLTLELYDDGHMSTITEGNGDVANWHVTNSNDLGPTDWHYVGVHWKAKSTDSVEITTCFDGKVGSTTADDVGSFMEAREITQVNAWFPCPWQNLQVWYSPDPPDDDNWPGESHTPQATFDKGMAWLDYLPEVTNDDSWDLIQEIAQSEYGTAGFDEEGRFYFRNRDSAVDNEPRETITANRGLKDIAGKLDIDSVRNIISTTSETGYWSGEPGRIKDTIWESDSPGRYESPPGRSRHTVHLDALRITFAEITISGKSSDDWDSDVTIGFVAVDATDREKEVSDDVSVSGVLKSSREIELIVDNHTNTTVRFQTKDDDDRDGEPALRVGGRKITDESEVVSEYRNDASVGKYGHQTLDLDKNRWRQHEDDLKALANSLLSDLSNPVPTIQDIEVVGNPLRSVRDTIRLRDPDGIIPDMKCTIVNLARRLSREDGLADTLTVRPVAPPATGILGDDDLGILSDTMILAP